MPTRNLPPRDVQQMMSHLRYEWASDSATTARFRKLVWESALDVARIAQSSPTPLGFSRRRLLRLERKLHAAAKDYAVLEKRVEGMTLNGEEKLKQLAEQVGYLLRRDATAKWRSKRLPETTATIKLLNFVYESTGQRHLLEIAYILHAAYSLSGIERDDLSPESLDAVYRRHMKHLGPQ